MSTGFAGCASSYMIPVTVTNTSTEKLSTIVVTYPEASFGINTLESGKSFHYKIKPTASGALKVEFFNSRGVDRVSPGPVLQQSNKGSIEIQLTQDGATWVMPVK
jgi:hypothetical protein